MTAKSSKILHRSEPNFVKIFLKCWLKYNLHVISKEAKAQKFRNFVLEMKKFGEYPIKPSYLSCYNFFRSLNPKTWNQAKKKRLFSLEKEIAKIFQDLDIRKTEHLLESSTRLELHPEEIRDNTLIEWEQVLSKNSKSETKQQKNTKVSQQQIITQLNLIKRQKTQIEKKLKQQLQDKLIIKLFDL